jgi:predicted glycogen debranching enzyme
MEFIFDKNTLHNFGEAIQHEWLETNGLGGWASSTIIGANTRKYHGLLVAATNPPVGRMVLLSKIDETLIYKRERMALGCNQYPGAIAPFGHIYLESFKKGIFPEFIYKAGKIELKKTIFAVHGENTTVIIYEVLNSPEAFDMELVPMVAGRDYHSLSHINQYIDEDTEFSNSVLSIKPYSDCPTLYISAPGGDYDIRPDWYYNFEYEYERNRGLEYHEDIYTPGRITLTLNPGQKIGIIISTENPAGRNPFELYAREEERRKKLINIPGYDYI